MDRVDEILFLYEDDRVEMANGGKTYKRTPQQAKKVSQRIKDNTPLKMDFFRHGTRSDDPARLKKIDNYVKEFEKDYGRKPTAKNIRTTLNEQRRVIPFYEEKYGKLPKGSGQKITNVQKDVVKILKDPKVIQKLNAGKFPTITDVTRITKLDPVLAETRLVDVAERLRDNPKYKTIADAYLDKPGVSSKDEIFGAKKGKRARVILENRFTKLMNLDQKLPSLRTNIIRKIQDVIPELKGVLSVDEIAGITSSMRRGSGPYAIFGQILGSDFNTNIKGRGIDRFKGVIEKELVSLNKDDPKRIELQKKYNESVLDFEKKANKNNPAKKVKGLKLSFKPPSETIKNKKIYNQYKDLFDTHYKTYGYSFEVPADRDSLVDISKKLDKKSFQNTIKNRFKNLIGRGGKLGAGIGLATLAGTGFALADEALAADGTEARSILPEVAGGAAAGSLAFKPVRQGVKKGLKATGRLLGKLAVPIGLGAEAYFAKQAYDEGKSIPEIMAAPFLLDSKVRQAQDMLRMKPEERQAVNREMIEEDFSGLSSDFDTPTLEGVDDVDIEEVKKRVLQERLADEARRREERKAGGGIAGLSGGIDEGPPPESGPNPQGLENLKYYVTNT